MHNNEFVTYKISQRIHSRITEPINVKELTFRFCLKTESAFGGNQIW